MEAVSENVLHQQLLDRRDRLAEAVVAGGAYLEGLLQEVDSALGRIDAGTYGRCEVCRDPIEGERLLADPLVCTCLGCLDDGQRRALERDLETAAEIQAALLPRRDLMFDGWEVHYHYQPAGPVSGDYCDLITPAEDRRDLYFVFGDISGKGVSASILMSHLKAIFRGLVASGPPLPELVERANRLFCESTLAQHYATVVCGRATAEGRIEIANAGHCPPLLLRRGEVTSLPATGMPVGMFANVGFAAESLRLEPGDVLFLHTDGLSEGRNVRQEEYGLERAATVLAHSEAGCAADLIDACLRDLRAFQAGTPAADDLTLMAIRRSVPADA